jgi:hypothetical protein
MKVLDRLDADSFRKIIGDTATGPVQSRQIAPGTYGEEEHLEMQSLASTRRKR